jgi:hypothetical protein
LSSRHTDACASSRKMTDRDRHGYGFTCSFVATGPMVTGKVPNFDTRAQTAPVAMVSRYTILNTSYIHSRSYDLPLQSDTRIWPRNKRSRVVDPEPRDCQRLPMKDFIDAAASGFTYDSLTGLDSVDLITVPISHQAGPSSSLSKKTIMSTNGLDFSNGAQPPLGDNPDIKFDPESSQPTHLRRNKTEHCHIQGLQQFNTATPATTTAYQPQSLKEKWDRWMINAAIARSAALVLHIDVIFILLPVCCNFISLLRRAPLNQFHSLRQEHHRP